MSPTSSTRATYTTTLLLLAGLGLTLHAAWRDQLTHALAGVVLTMIALTAIILTTLKRWITSTTAERADLADAQRAAHTEHDRYLAARADLEAEQVRFTRDMAAQRRQLVETLKVERQAMQDEFARLTGELSADATAIALSWIQGNKLCPPERQRDNLIRFPKQTEEQAPAPQGQSERAREHGVVRP